MPDPNSLTVSARPAESRRRLSLLGCDSFLLALDSLMRRAGQGAHVSQSVLELDQAPQREKLEQAWRGFVQDHPIVRAKLGRSWVSALPIWRIPSPQSAPVDGTASVGNVMPIGWWRESGGEPAAPQQGRSDGHADWQPIQSLEALCQRRRDFTASRKRPPFHLRLDVLEKLDRRAALVVTWSHLLVDGKGVELMLTDLARRAGDALVAPDAAAASQPAPAFLAAKPPSSLRDKMRRSRAFVEHFYKMAATRFHSLGGAKPLPGQVHCRVVTLDEQATQRVNERAAKLASQLINTPFFLAASATAHARVFEARGHHAGPQIITLPIQTRPKGGSGPMFQNHVTILFFMLSSEQLATVEQATAAVQQQFAQMMRHRLDASFSMMLDLMRWLPPRMYAWFLRRQMRGEITSFFHSYTGPFAPTLKTLAGARVTDAWHIPVISTPPGTGLFVGERDGRLSLSMSWREGALTPDERDLLLRAFITDLVGYDVDALTVNLHA